MPTGPEQLITVGSEAGFAAWVESFRPRALARGISEGVFDRAFKGAAYDPYVIEKDRNQGEFVKPIWEYLDKAVSDERVANGKKALRKYGRLLKQIEATYGVDKEIVTAVWGLESSYGANRGDLPLIQSLATLAYDGRRGGFFEDQLIAALKIIQAGNVAPRNMTGSWAGAMGHTQFIPTSYLAFAVDHDGDGKRDIWSDDPTDALASTAAYLARSGWKHSARWGIEVRLPRRLRCRPDRRGGEEKRRRMGGARCARCERQCRRGGLRLDTPARWRARRGLHDLPQFSGHRTLQCCGCLCDCRRPPRRPAEGAGADPGLLAARGSGADA